VWDTGRRETEPRCHGDPNRSPTHAHSRVVVTAIIKRLISAGKRMTYGKWGTPVVANQQMQWTRNETGRSCLGLASVQERGGASQKKNRIRVSGGKEVTFCVPKKKGGRCKVALENSAVKGKSKQRQNAAPPRKDPEQASHAKRWEKRPTYRLKKTACHHRDGLKGTGERTNGEKHL